PPDREREDEQDDPADDGQDCRRDVDAAALVHRDRRIGQPHRAAVATRAQARGTLGGMSTNFDERAATWDDDPVKVERSQRAADGIRKAVPLVGTARLLEYGAGTGLVSQALRAYVGPVTLADTSSGMRAVMERKIADGSLTDARVWDVDL